MSANRSCQSKLASRTHAQTNRKEAAPERFQFTESDRHWDSGPAPGFGIEDLSPQTLAHFRKLAERSERLSADCWGKSDREFLKKLWLYDGSRLKRAAVLLFGTEPERLIAGAYLEIAAFHSEGNRFARTEIHGNLLTQADQGLDLLLNQYLQAGHGSRSPQPWATLPVPARAVNEALLNAIAHKDYSAGLPIQVSVYADKIQIWNPGQLPSGWTQADLATKHPFYPANPAIADTLFRAAYLTAWGTGFELIRQTCREHGCPKPLVRWENGISVELRFRAPLTALAQAAPRRRRAAENQTAATLAAAGGASFRRSEGHRP
jgi:ATP-dependent DNA helicase RecG